MRRLLLASAISLVLGACADRNAPADTAAAPASIDGVELIPREHPEPPCSAKVLGEVTAAAFGQRRKMLRTSLKSLTAMPELLLKDAGLAPELRGDNPVAILEVLLVAVSYAIAPQIAARKLQNVPSLPMTVACLIFATVVYAPPAVATWPATVPSGWVLAAIAGLSVICTAIGFLVFFALLREVGPSRALVFTYLNPAVAVAAGVLVLGEPLTVSMVAAFVLILAGSVLATRAGRAQRTVEAAEAAT